MNRIISNYEINTQTIAILPARKIEYDTIVLERNQVKRARQTARKIITNACFDNCWTTYEGRLQAVTYHTNFIQKVPIPINIEKRICLFPTHSPQNIDNIWLSLEHISHIRKARQTKQIQTIIYFKNGTSLILNVSEHTLRTQMNRAWECMYKMEMMKTI